MSNADLSSVRVQEQALRNAYQADDPNRCAVHHLNLSNHLRHAGAVPAVYLCHLTAGVVLCFQTGSDLLIDSLGQLALAFAEYAPKRPPTPETFDELCDLVEAVDGVRFRAMVADLRGERGADGDEAFHAVLGMARRMALRG